MYLSPLNISPCRSNDRKVINMTHVSTTTKKAPSGGWYGYVNYRDSSGKRRQKKVKGYFKLKREAQEAAEHLKFEMDKSNIDLVDVSFTDYYRKWVELYKANKIHSHSARYQYKLVGDKIGMYFHQKKLKDIRRSDYQAFINWYGANHSYESVRKLKGFCNTCIQYAVDDGIINKNFTNNVEIVYDNSHTRKVEYLSNDELTRLKKMIVSKLDHRYTSRYMILTAIYTGMRKAEIQALTWNDIDFLHSTISINKSWDEKEKTFKSTKTDSSNRVIRVNRELLKHLEDLKVNNSTMVFRTIFGTIPTSNALNTCLHKVMKEAKISKRGFHFHSLRHVHVAFLIGQGVDIYAISKRLGHANVNITLKVYAYLIDEYRTKNDNLIVKKLANI